MKILFICPYTPFPLTDGGKTRVFNIIKRLSLKHDISLICYIKSEKDRAGIPELSKYCEKVIPVLRRPVWSPVNLMITLFTRYPFSYVVNGFSKAMEKFILQELEAEKYDLIHVENYFMSHPVIRALKRHELRIPKLLAVQNIEYLVYERYSNVEWNIIKKLLLFIDARKTKKIERGSWGYYDLCIFASAIDMGHFKRYYPYNKSAVIGNGVDVDFYKPSGVSADECSMAFLGNFRYIANVDAINYFMRDIMPLVVKKNAGATLRIIGNDPLLKASKLLGPGIYVTGYVEDVREELKRAQVFIAPIRIGSGTKLKILEAMAMGMPVVGTTVAFEGLDVKDGQDAFIEDEPERFAGRVVDLLADPSLRRKIGSNARRVVESKYDWNNIAIKLNEYYNELICRT